MLRIVLFQMHRDSIRRNHISLAQKRTHVLEQRLHLFAQQVIVLPIDFALGLRLLQRGFALLLHVSLEVFGFRLKHVLRSDGRERRSVGYVRSLEVRRSEPFDPVPVRLDLASQTQHLRHGILRQGSRGGTLGCRIRARSNRYLLRLRRNYRNTLRRHDYARSRQHEHERDDSTRQVKPGHRRFPISKILNMSVSLPLAVKGLIAQVPVQRGSQEHCSGSQVHT